MKNNKTLNAIRVINKGVFFLTLGLFITIYLGFLLEILLGIVQVLSSLVLIFFWKQFSKNVKEKLINYWVVTGVYLLLWFIDWKFLNDWIIYIVGVGLIPMGIAIYFLNLLNVIREESHQTTLIEEIGIV